MVGLVVVLAAAPVAAEPVAALLARARQPGRIPAGSAAEVVAMGGAGDRPALRRLLGDPRADRRALAAAGLHGLGDARDMPALLAATCDHDGVVARAAMQAVLDLTPPAGLPALRGAIARAHPRARAEARSWLALPVATPAPPEPMPLSLIHI